MGMSVIHSACGCVCLCPCGYDAHLPPPAEQKEEEFRPHRKDHEANEEDQVLEVVGVLERTV